MAANTGKMIAKSMGNFAEGIYGSIDTRSATKAINKNIKNGMMPTVAKANHKALQNTQGYKIGKGLMNSKPMSGIKDSARQMTRAHNTGQKIDVKDAL